MAPYMLMRYEFFIYCIFSVIKLFFEILLDFFYWYDKYVKVCYDWGKGAENHNPSTAKTSIYLHLPQVHYFKLIYVGPICYRTWLDMIEQVVLCLTCIGLQFCLMGQKQKDMNALDMILVCCCRTLKLKASLVLGQLEGNEDVLYFYKRPNLFIFLHFYFVGINCRDQIQKKNK